MILEYHRPHDLAEAIQQLKQTVPPSFPLGGGTTLSQEKSEPFAVVDLQLLGLNSIDHQGNAIAIGATATLESIIQHADVPTALKDAIRLDATLNKRNAATAAGMVVAGDGSSAYLTVLLAADTHLNWMPGNTIETLGDYLPLRHIRKMGRLITKIDLPVQADLKFTSVGRSPLDKPLICIALARWPSGRLRIVLGGEAPAPVLVLDGSESGSIEGAINNACSQISTKWASREYLNKTTEKLIYRMLHA